MTFSVLVEQDNGQFTAALIGSPNLRKVGSTRAEAVAALRVEIKERVQRGELLSLEIEPVGVSSLAGLFAGDESLREICEEAYRIRDEEQTP